MFEIRLERAGSSPLFLFHGHLIDRSEPGPMAMAATLFCCQIKYRETRLVTAAKAQMRYHELARNNGFEEVFSCLFSPSEAFEHETLSCDYWASTLADKVLESPTGDVGKLLLDHLCSLGYVYTLTADPIHAHRSGLPLLETSLAS
ncbi:hypothetical protein NRY68_10725 [Acidithiobacillus ferrooxidans]|uniref:hypothetical protein n=1 Tax=Acidithiobacillus ferrooxidans TaxID=920 RepID=UPI0021477097|nr:hypothetical protein [Acidithiobacillus ferrooxidans]MCR1346267.1 hypothetical protein [Acidithiobacillus ferrooxidans]MCR1355300.1 hypothetical protein [Acidithiobacillus ferrooxidans]